MNYLYEFRKFISSQYLNTGLKLTLCTLIPCLIFQYFGVLEQFIAAVERTEDSKCREVLSKLCTLYALNQLNTHKGWYLEDGYMEGVKTKAIRKSLDQMCWEIRQDAVPLVDAFRIPESLLRLD